MIFSFVQRCNNLLTYPSFVIHSFFWLQPLFLKLVTEFITRSLSWSCCVSALEMLLTYLSMKTAWLLDSGCLDSSITPPPLPQVSSWKSWLLTDDNMALIWSADRTRCCTWEQAGNKLLFPGTSFRKSSFSMFKFFRRKWKAKVKKDWRLIVIHKLLY